MPHLILAKRLRAIVGPVCAGYILLGFSVVLLHKAGHVCTDAMITMEVPHPTHVIVATVVFLCLSVLYLSLIACGCAFSPTKAIWLHITIHILSWVAQLVLTITATCMFSADIIITFTIIQVLLICAWWLWLYAPLPRRNVTGPLERLALGFYLICCTVPMTYWLLHATLSSEDGYGWNDMAARSWRVIIASGFALLTVIVGTGTANALANESCVYDVKAITEGLLPLTRNTDTTNSRRGHVTPVLCYSTRLQANLAISSVWFYCRRCRFCR
jgi:hypothetical protein